MKERTHLSSFSPFFSVLAAALCLILAVPGAHARALTSDDIAELVQQCPVLDEYKGAPAVIWSRKQLYTQDEQNRTVKTCEYVLLCDPSAELDFLGDLMIAPAGGRIELEQAAIFDPISSELIREVSYSEDEFVHGHIALRMPHMSDEYVFVLSYRQYYPEPGILEDVVWLASEFPTWEGSVQVRIAKDQALLYESSTEAEPTMSSDSKYLRYGWFYFKQPANRGMRGLVESSDPYLLFSLNKGSDTSVAMMNDLSSRTWGSIPEIYVETEGDTVTKDLKTIEKFWRSSSRIRGNATWRSADLVPENGPWTTWEAVYVAAQWLRQRGWKADVWFQHVQPQSKVSLSCAPGFEHPVLLLAEPGGKQSWYYIPGQPSELKKLPASLRGKALYSAGAKSLRKKSISAAKMEKNRLSIAWDLKVADDCVVTGTLEVRVRNAWVEYFDALAEGRVAMLYTLLDGVKGWLDLEGALSVKPLGSQGFRLILPIKARSGIEGPQGMMVALPSVTPGPVVRLQDLSGKSELRIPFVVEQSYNVVLPKGFRMLAPPAKQEQSSAVSTYSSQFRYNSRKNVLEGEEKYIQAYTGIENYDLPAFKRLLDTWGIWQRSSLALVPAGGSKKK